MDSYRLETQFLKVIAHPARLRILDALRGGEQCVCHLTALLHQRQAYVSQQLMLLREASLIADRKDGLRVYYRIKDQRVFDALDTVTAIVGVTHPTTERQVIGACPCPKCEGNGQRPGEKPWRSRSSVPVAPTA
jgi:DNA-binding transcriptional ArsR family regulator